MIESSTVHSFEAHPKQQDFINSVAREGLTFIAYGGSAGGGKTYVSLAVLITLCKIYPGSRWAVIRKSLTEIKLNTLPSFWKLAPKSFIKTFNKSEFLVIFNNESQLFFKGENIHDDPELQWMDGLEVNGFLLEQVEELNYKTFDKCKLRAGRWVMRSDKMPPIKILMTLNPSQNWTKKIIYDPYVNGTLHPPYAYIPAKILDNPSLPKQYVEGLKNLDILTYRRFVEGDWDAFSVNKPYAYAFDFERHVKTNEYNTDLELWQSFDFNIDPLTSISVQHSEADRVINVLSEIKLKNGNTDQMCDMVISQYGHYNPIYLITGDSTGRNRNAIAGNINHYYIIRSKLQCSNQQMKVKKKNISPKNLRVLMNSLFQNYTIKISPDCVNLINDLKYVEVDDFGDVKKSNRSQENQRADFLDCLAYAFEAIMPNFVKFPTITDDNNFDNE